MKISLIEITYSTPYMRYVPTASMHLKAYAESRFGDKHEIEVRTFSDLSPKLTSDVALGSKVLAYIDHEAPDIVGFSCYLWNIGYVLQLCASINKLCPDVKVILGGPEVTQDTIREDIDFVVVGEGEEAFVKILEFYEGEIPLREIPNVTYMAEGEVTSNPVEQPDLSGMVSPYEGDYDPYPGNDYCLETSRGCPFSCSYCAWSNTNVRFMPESYIESCLKTLLSEWNINGLYVVDSNFVLNAGHLDMVLGLLKKYNTHGTDIKVEISIDRFDDELIRKFKEARVRRLDVGIQTTDPQVLAGCCRKGPDLELARSQITKLIAAGFITQTHLILGMPYDNFFKSAETLKFLTSIPKNMISINTFFVLKHSGFDNRRELAVPLSEVSSRCVRTNTQSPMDIERSFLFLKTYEKEFRASQSHPVHEDTVRYR